MKRTTIFSQLVLNIIIPVTLALVLVAVFFFFTLRSVMQGHNVDKNKGISKEIKTVMKFQDVSLSIVEEGLGRKMSNLTSKMINDVYLSTDSIETADLDVLMKELEMIKGEEDIYIINRQGIIVNTTFKKDMGLNLYGFGEEYKAFLLGVFNDGRFHLDRFSPESKTGKLKKYSYRVTKDGKYIIELGFYSEDANHIMAQAREEVNGLANRHESIEKVDLFFGKEHPVSFSNSEDSIDASDMEEYTMTIENEGKGGSIEFDRDANDQSLHYEFIYFYQNNSELFKDGVIRIISDRSEDTKTRAWKLAMLSIICGVLIILISYLIIKRSRAISSPIMKLAQSVTTIADGDLTERTEVVGNNEITTLSEQFNDMLARLQKSYDSLEQKVIERTAEIFSQKEKIEAQNHQITDSIRYAKRIQTAILPSDEVLDQTIHDHFVLFKPRDIVSGDFYWTGHKDGKSIIAAADCTGHGVPGAFMSMIGNTLLNQIVNENGTTKPAQILWDMRKEILNLLSQKGSKNVTKSKDGMDVAICTIDYENKKMQYSGANNPLFMVRDGELIVVKGSRAPVGAHMLEEEPFENHDIDLKEGDLIYIFSDGYQDQYGGDLNRKFMVGRLKRFFVEIHKKPMQSQKEIMNQTIEEWMADTKQIDDILVIGMKI